MSAANPSAPTLRGTLTQPTNVDGVFTFSDLTVDTVALGYKLHVTAPSPSTASADSNTFTVAQIVTRCTGNTCPGHATDPNITVLDVSAIGTTTANTLGIALSNPLVPASGCGSLQPAPGSDGSFVDVNFVPSGATAGPTLTITWTLLKAIVNKMADNGASHYNMCLGAVNLNHPDGSGVVPWTTKQGLPATGLADVDANGNAVKRFWGILPDCPKKIVGPCVISRTKNGAGDLLFKYAVPFPWDPNGYLG
jgi:hypothetical protein